MLVGEFIIFLVYLHFWRSFGEFCRRRRPRRRASHASCRLNNGYQQSCPRTRHSCVCIPFFVLRKILFILKNKNLKHPPKPIFGFSFFFINSYENLIIMLSFFLGLSILESQMK